MVNDYNYDLTGFSFAIVQQDNSGDKDEVDRQLKESKHKKNIQVRTRIDHILKVCLPVDSINDQWTTYNHL